MTETITETIAVAPQRKCAIEEMFEPSFIELLQLVPTNPLVRAWVLKFSGKLPPAECVTFAQLKEWGEFNCVKRVRKVAGHPAEGSGAIEIEVEFSEQEYGRANYSVNCTGTGTFELSQEELLEIIRDCIADGESLTEVVDAVSALIDDEAWDRCEPSMQDYGDYEYNEHDAGGSENSGITFSRDRVRDKVLRFIQQQHPELAQEL